MHKLTPSLNQCLNVSLIFTGLLFLLPFINLHHTYPIVTFYAEWIAGLLGLAASFVLLHPAILANMQIPRISLVFLGLAIFVALQWLVGLLASGQDALLTMSYLIWAFLLTIIGSELRSRFGWEKLITTFAWFLVIAGTFNAGIVVLQIVVRTGGAISFLPYFTNYGAIPQPNHFADFTALATISLIYLYIKERFSLTFFTIMLVWFLMAFSFSGSRSAWLYLIAIAILAFLVHQNAIKNDTNLLRSSRLLRITLLALPIFALVQLLIYYIAPDGLVWSTSARLAELASNDTPSARLSMWYDSLRLFLQSPWLGGGVGSMRMETFLLLDTPAEYATNRIFEHAHNLFFHLLAEMGIFAFLLVCFGLTLWIKAFKWSALNLETWWLIGLLSVLGIHSLLEYPLWFAYFLGIAALLLGAGDESLIAINSKKTSDGSSLQLNIKLSRALLAIVLIAGAVNLATLLIANLKLEKSLHQLKTLDASQQHALDWVNHYSLLTPYAKLIQAIKMKIDSDDIDQQFMLNEAALTFRPFRKIAYQHVILLKLKGDHAGAVNLLKRTMIVYPYENRYLQEYFPEQYRQEFLTILSEASSGAK
jgi:O-antigen ligase